MHPLEGKYIVYLYGNQDYEAERWGLALYRLEGDRMNTVFHPMDYDNPIVGNPSVGDITNRTLIDLMKKQGITEVYSVHHAGDFFGIPGGWISLQEGEPKEIELWAEWKSLYEDDDEYTLLAENGITVKCYDNDTATLA